MALLPSSFFLKSVKSSKYLRYISDEGSNSMQKLLQCSAEDILDDPNVKFGVEAASTGKGLVHIRSSYSNKYWMRLSESESWVAAAGEDKEEDQSKWSCTLFEPVKVADEDGKLIIRLRHVQSGLYPKVYTMAVPDYKVCMYLMYDKPDDSKWDLFVVIDCASLVILPKQMALKGDNGKYLALTNGNLEFSSDDIGLAGVAMEVVPASGSEGSGDGNIRIKCVKNQRYWKVFGGSIPDVVDATLVNEKDGALFKPIKVGDTIIALKYLNNNLFCSTLHNSIDGALYLSANTSTISKTAQLVVEEPVFNRTISVTYRLEDARKYDLTPVSLCTVEHQNDDDEPMVKIVTLDYTTKLTSSWEAMNSWTVGIKATVEVETIPLISKASIELSAEYAGSYTWGETKTEGQDFSDSDTYTVRPKHKLIVSKLATKGHCDVPYSYTQTDTMSDGQIITTTKSDGVYKGINYFDIYTESNQIPI